jgi:hypothetical protein
MTPSPSHLLSLALLLYDKRLIRDITPVVAGFLPLHTRSFVYRGFRPVGSNSNPRFLRHHKRINIKLPWGVLPDVCMYVYTYVCMYVCMYVCIVKYWVRVLYTCCDVTQKQFKYLRGISNGFTEFITNRALYPPIILLQSTAHILKTEKKKDFLFLFSGSQPFFVIVW